MDRKLGWKGGARTHQQEHLPVPQGCPWLTTRSPQTMQCSLDYTKMHTMTSFHHTSHHNDTAHFIHGWSSTTFTQSLTLHTLKPLLQPDCARNQPGTSTSLTDWTGLGGFCHTNGGAQQKSKVTLSRGHTHPTYMTSTGLVSKALLQKALPNLRHQNQH